MVITRGNEEDIQIFPRQDLQVNTVIVLKKLLPYPQKWYQEGVRIDISALGQF